jgi:hypothetical protein
MFVQQINIARMIFLYGKMEDAKTFGVLYRGQTRPACSGDYQWIFYPIAGDDNNLISCLSSTPSLITANTINTVTSTYQNNMTDPLTNSFINNTQATIIAREGALDTGAEHFAIGVNFPYATFLSMRLYNRVLSAAEIQHNAALDQIRYLLPPT